ncbi:hypothetical protein [Microbacterium sp. NPDC096154]|uniref:hypothetical protein n=1 Tax=Microbacterium sp. NPDC096154 TaxID=3155549 RepID=UPI00332B8ED4
MSTPPPVPRTFPFDARPLIDPADPRDVHRFHEELKRRFPTSSGSVVALVILAVIAVPMLGGILTVFATVLTAFAQNGMGVVTIPFVLLVVGMIALVVWALIRHFGGAAKERRFRLDGFARANHMHYLPRLDAPKLPGMIFDQGSSRLATDLVRGEQPRFVEFANYQYTTGSGKNQTTHRWGYVAIHLGTPLPHIVLDAVGNNGLFGSNLPASFGRAQRLSLEGDFDRYFTLYCPEGYERDALYLFTPDIMARFMDNVAQLDVEIVDDWMFLYTGRHVSTLDPATWAWLFSAVAALMDKLTQWARWRDERLATEGAPAAQTGALSGQPVAPGAEALPFSAPAQMVTPPPLVPAVRRGVAAPGRRLKRRVPVVVVIVLVVIGATLVLPWIGGMLAALTAFGS